MTWLLVAKDYEDLRGMLADALRGHGYEVHVAGDGAEAVQMLDAAIEMPAVLLRNVGRARHLPVVLITDLELRDAAVDKARAP
jgi:CheY-like chemotaxis protein